MRIEDIPEILRKMVKRGMVIPAHPLALTKDRKLDERRQRALTRYYIDAGVGGIAVGVHTTQFAIRYPRIGLFRPVLELASSTIDERCAKTGREIFKIAGACGRTRQAVDEASAAADMGYHACLLNLSELRGSGVAELMAHCREVAAVMPVFGFYLNPRIGGIELPYAFWREFAGIENVIAVKDAPFDRYRTLDVVRAVCDSGREKDVAIYTGNDDTIVFDLLSEYRFRKAEGEGCARIVGGLLGHWAVWTRRAVEMLASIHSVVESRGPVPPEMMALAHEVTDCNGAFFDARNDFAGCIPGVHEVLRGQGLLEGTWCLDPNETLSPGQKEEIDRVSAAYPHLNDDEFVKQHLDEWLS